MYRIYNPVLVLFSLRSALSAALNRFTVVYNQKSSRSTKKYMCIQHAGGFVLAQLLMGCRDVLFFSGNRIRAPES